jgi:hypothetical protein
VATRNITRVFRSVYTGPNTDGMTWYREAHDFALTLSDDVAMASGVIAALSPRISWGYNKRLAQRAFDEGHASGHLGMCTRKADAILSGIDPLEVLTSPKVNNFYRCILDPDDALSVVIDRHAYDIYQGKVTPDIEKDALKRKGVYDTIAQSYISAAKILSRETGTVLLPSTIQAVTWVAWRQQPGKGRGIHREEN